MRFSPDLLVLAHDLPEVALAVEVKASIADPAAAEAQLRHYMADRRCHVALIVTPTTSWIYAENSAGEIERVGDFSTAVLLGRPSIPTDGRGLLQAVRGWLEGLAEGRSTLSTRPEVRQPMVRHLLPAVADGRVVAGGPHQSAA
ncbi:MAG: hypothetical protein AABZ30_16175 [Myxococcota bacterium]